MTPRPRQLPLRLLLFGAVAIAAFGLGFLAFNVETSRLLVKRYGYYTIAGTFVWAAFALWRVFPAAFREWRTLSRNHVLQAAAAVVACTLVVVLTTPLNYKILYDEMVLQSTASVMHIYRDVSTVVRAYNVDGVFAPLDTYVDKRPFFFPFVVSLVHDATGYRESNAFWVNLGLLPLILAQVYLLVRRLCSHAGGLAALVALGTLSTLAQSATGAGMEMLNLSLILLAMQLCVFYLDAPDEPRLAAVILATVLLAQTRYESSLFVLPVAAIILEGWRRTGRIIMPVAAILAPALLIPYAVHNTYLSGTPSLWELRENEHARFGLTHLRTNLEHAWGYFFAVRRGLTNSLWLSTAGFVGLLYCGCLLIRDRKQVWSRLRSAGKGGADASTGAVRATTTALVVAAFSVAIVGNLALLMFYYWGQLDDPVVVRLALPFSVLLAIAIGFAIHRLDRPLRPLFGDADEAALHDLVTRPGPNPRRRGLWLATCGAVLAYLWSGLLANEQQNRRNTLEGELAWEGRFVAALPPGERLIITNKSSLPWVLNHVSAISIDRARRRMDSLARHLNRDTFREILVTQNLQPTAATGVFQLHPPDRLPDWCVLETVAEKRFGAHLDRISRVVEIKLPPAKTDPPTKSGP